MRINLFLKSSLLLSILYIFIGCRPHKIPSEVHNEKIDTLQTIITDSLKGSFFGLKPPVYIKKDTLHVNLFSTDTILHNERLMLMYQYLGYCIENRLDSCRFVKFKIHTLKYSNEYTGGIYGIALINFNSEVFKNKNNTFIKFAHYIMDSLSGDDIMTMDVDLEGLYKF